MPEANVLGTTLLKKLLGDIYVFVKDNAGIALTELQNEKYIRELHKKLDSIQKVKTIWQVDKEVKLMSFYYPSSLNIDGFIRSVTSVEEISRTGNIVIQGIVGQGKSIFLRFLCVCELLLGVRIPIFLELRRIENSASFRSHLYNTFKIYKLRINDELFETYANSGRIVLLLDGFDEIKEDLITGIINELELLAQQFPDLQIVITSRPDSGIQRSPHFRVYKLMPLGADDHMPFLEKLSDDSVLIEGALKAINNSSVDIKSLLTTPLLLTLLVIVYKAGRDIPPTLPEFYDCLFQTLITRHDGTKPGFRRKRRTGLGDVDLKRLFEAFCFVVKQKHHLTLSENQLAGCLQIACKATGINCDSSDFCEDITKTACLMVEEGFNYHFVHKSVLEFNVASFVRHSQTELAIKFYAQMMNGDWEDWRQELHFLGDIDKYRYLKYFFVPSFQRFLKHFEIESQKKPTGVSPGKIVQFANSMIIHIERKNRAIEGRLVLATKPREFIAAGLLVSMQDAFKQLFETKNFPTRGAIESGSIGLGDAAFKSGKMKNLHDSFIDALNIEQKKFHEANKYLQIEDAKVSLLSL